LSREDIRSTAGGRAVDADGADQIIKRLVVGGILREVVGVGRSSAGRPARRWAINPALVSPQHA